MRGTWSWGEVFFGVLGVLVALMGLQLWILQQAVETQRDIQEVQSRLLQEIAQKLVCSPDVLLVPFSAEESDER